LTIKRKNIRPSGLLEVESDNTDTVDTNGFSDALSVVGAETAKFSGGATMQANSGLRIGIIQIKVNSDVVTPRIGVVIAGSFGTKTIDGDSVTVDFGDIAQANLFATAFHNCNCSQSSRLEFSTDDITYFSVSFINTSTSQAVNHNGGTQTYRYARLTAVTVNVNSINLQAIFETALASSTTYNIRSSATLDTADGTILVGPIVIGESSQDVFDTDLLLTGNTQFVTLEVVSYTEGDVPITLSEITSIKEV